MKTLSGQGRADSPVFLYDRHAAGLHAFRSSIKETSDRPQTATNRKGPMQEITLDSHAKINLSLRITARRDDGYHEIVSFMQGAGIHDVVRIKKCSQNGTKYNLPHCLINGIDVYLCTNADTIPADMSNLAFKGAKAFADAYMMYAKGGASSERSEASAAELPKALLIELDKRLPVAAGIAGGSGNAAVCMLGLNALAGHPFSLRELMTIGVSAGADVPFSVFMNAHRNRAALEGLEGIEEASDAAWTSGIGDIIEAAEPYPAYVILANPGTGVSTKAAYEAMDAIGYDRGGDEPRELFVNDLEKYTLREDAGAAELKALMEERLSADKVLMSGSGPTIAAYYRDSKKAGADLELLTGLCRSRGVRLWMTETGI